MSVVKTTCSAGEKRKVAFIRDSVNDAIGQSVPSLMIGCVGEVARGASGTAELSQRLSASLRRMTRESPARGGQKNGHRYALAIF